MSRFLSSSRGSPDAWLKAAAAVAAAVSETPGVAALAGSAVYQTRGRGAVVKGVAVSAARSGGATAEVGLVVGLGAFRSRRALDAVLAEARARARRAWEQLGMEGPFHVLLHLVDIAIDTAEWDVAEAAKGDSL